MTGGPERRAGKRRGEDDSNRRVRPKPVRAGVATNRGGGGRSPEREIQPARSQVEGCSRYELRRAADATSQRKQTIVEPDPVCRPFIIPSSLVTAGIMPEAIDYYFSAHIGERMLISGPSGAVYSVLIESRDHGPVLGSGWKETLHVEGYRDKVKVLLEPTGDRRFKMRLFEEGIEAPCVNHSADPELIIEFESDDSDHSSRDDSDSSSSDESDSSSSDRSSSESLDEDAQTYDGRFVVATNTTRTEGLTRRMEELRGAYTKETKLDASTIMPSHIKSSQFFFNTEFSRAFPRSCAEAKLKMEGAAGYTKVTLTRSSDRIYRITTGWNVFCSKHMIKTGQVFIFALYRLGRCWEIVLHRIW